VAANVARRRFASQHALTPLAELEPLEEPATIVIGPGPSDDPNGDGAAGRHGGDQQNQAMRLVTLGSHRIGLAYAAGAALVQSMFLPAGRSVMRSSPFVRRAGVGLMGI
jgi:hypothetical protein